MSINMGIHSHSKVLQHCRIVRFSKVEFVVKVRPINFLFIANNYLSDKFLSMIMGRGRVRVMVRLGYVTVGVGYASGRVEVWYGMGMVGVR